MSNRFFILFLTALAVAAALAIAAGAGAAVRTANTLFALFLGLVNEQTAQGKDANDHSQDNNISCIHNLTLSHIPLTQIWENAGTGP